MAGFYNGDNESTQEFGQETDKFGQGSTESLAAARQAAADSAASATKAQTSEQGAIDTVSSVEVAAVNSQQAADDAALEVPKAETAAQNAETAAQNAANSETNANLYALDAQVSASFLENMTTTATTLEYGEIATANYDVSTNILNIGIPKGKDGKDGENGGGGSSGIAIGEVVKTVGPIESITYDGEFKDLRKTWTVEGVEYADYISINRDIEYNSGGLTLVEATGNKSFYSFPENIIRDNEQGFYIRPNNTSCYLESGVRELTTARSFIPFGSSERFWNTPGITEDDGNGYESISSGLQRYSYVPIKNVIKFDGTVISESLVCCLYRRGYVQRFAIYAHSLDQYDDILNEFLPYSGLENDYNSKYAGDPNTNIGEVYFKEDSFYRIRYDTRAIERFSYDFSGGTLKPLSVQNYDSLLNDDVDDYIACIQIGNETGNIYQFDALSKSIYINGSKVADLSFVSKLGVVSDLALSFGYFNFIVQEINGKVFMYVAAQDSRSSTAGCASGMFYDYADVENIKTYTIPLFMGEETSTTFNISMAIRKINIETGLIVSSPMSARGNSKQTDPTNEEDSGFMLSFDFGQTWYKDLYIGNKYNNRSIEDNNMYIAGVDSTYGAFCYYYANYNNNDMINTAFVSSNDSQLIYLMESTNWVETVNYKPAVILDKSTNIGTTFDSNTLNHFVRVK